MYFLRRILFPTNVPQNGTWFGQFYFVIIKCNVGKSKSKKNFMSYQSVNFSMYPSVNTFQRVVVLFYMVDQAEMIILVRLCPFTLLVFCNLDFLVPLQLPNIQIELESYWSWWPFFRTSLWHLIKNAICIVSLRRNSMQKFMTL